MFLPYGFVADEFGLFLLLLDFLSQRLSVLKCKISLANTDTFNHAWKCGILRGKSTKTLSPTFKINTPDFQSLSIMHFLNIQFISSTYIPS